MHALKHYNASTLLEGGVSIRALADYLGHSDPGFTLRGYAHLMPASEERAGTVVDVSLSAAAESSAERQSRPRSICQLITVSFTCSR
ncbi:MAG TPA: tyrosine-type recombinase/integrase [Acidimicrobiia bacterium]|jgi:hypothetical protein|nr:tyrosine-type recombinase/integrase [Acidimicrobiia bacterium]